MTASPSLSIERITAASIENVEPIAETLALAFDDHIMRALCGTDAELRLARMRATAVTTIKDLECYVAHLPGSKRADCVMLVKPPGLEHGVR
jgi:hypothetical protein